MNNQDKADEIAKELENCNFDKESAWQGAMNMADWKDEQIKKMLIIIYSFHDIKNIKGYVNEIYKSLQVHT